MNQEFYQYESFLCLDGPAKKAGLKHSNMKVCFTTKDSEFLKKLLIRIAQDEHCYWVKLSTKSRDGMFLGRSFFTTKEKAGETWAKYKMHPRLMVTLQDDDFSSAYREFVVSWQEKSEDALD